MKSGKNAMGEFSKNFYESLSDEEWKIFHKRCKRCARLKPTKKFFRTKNNLYSAYCRACHYNYNMTWHGGGHSYQRGYGSEIKAIVIEHYSNGKNCCECCGEYRIEFLCIDHVNEDGAEHRRKIRSQHRGSLQFYPWLIKNNFPNDPPLRVLCFNCNIAEFRGGCPHKREVIPLVPTEQSEQSEQSEKLNSLESAEEV